MDFVAKEKPNFASLALDGWSVHSHGYMGVGRCVLLYIFFNLITNKWWMLDMEAVEAVDC